VSARQRPALVSAALPEWARELSESCSLYAFTTMRVHEGRAVVATRTRDGTGPLLVITADETEMRAALNEPTPSS
jgi:hypothetical protein